MSGCLQDLEPLGIILHSISMHVYACLFNLSRSGHVCSTPLSFLFVFPAPGIPNHCELASFLLVSGPYPCAILRPFLLPHLFVALQKVLTAQRFQKGLARQSVNTFFAFCCSTSHNANSVFLSRFLPIPAMPTKKRPAAASKGKGKHGKTPATGTADASIKTKIAPEAMPNASLGAATEAPAVSGVPHATASGGGIPAGYVAAAAAVMASGSEVNTSPSPAPPAESDGLEGAAGGSEVNTSPSLALPVESDGLCNPMETLKAAGNLPATGTADASIKTEIAPPTIPTASPTEAPAVLGVPHASASGGGIPAGYVFAAAAVPAGGSEVNTSPSPALPADSDGLEGAAGGEVKTSQLLALPAESDGSGNLMETLKVAGNSPATGTADASIKTEIAPAARLTALEGMIFPPSLASAASVVSHYLEDMKQNPIIADGHVQLPHDHAGIESEVFHQRPAGYQLKFCMMCARAVSQIKSFESSGSALNYFYRNKIQEISVHCAWMAVSNLVQGQGLVWEPMLCPHLSFCLV